MTEMLVQMQVMTTQMNVGSKVPIMRTFTARPLQHNLAYSPTAFLPLLQAVNSGGITTPPRECYLVRNCLRNCHLLPDYATGSTTTNIDDLYASHNVLLDPMISALRPKVIAYIVGMVSGKYVAGKGGRGDAYCHQILPSLGQVSDIPLEL